MKKIFLKISLSLLVLFIAFNILLVICIKERDKKICLKDEYRKLEYGEIYNPELKDLIDLNEFDFLDETNVIIESNTIKEEGKDYFAVGKYNINVLYKDFKFIQIVEITDTVCPELTIQEVIEIEYGTDLSTYDFNKYITMSDLSELKDYVIDLSKINSSVSGEYENIISIEDVYGNKTEKKFTITILEKVEEVEVLETSVIEEKEEETHKKANTSTKKETKKNEVTTSKKQESEPKKVEENKNSNNTNPEEKQEDVKEDIVYEIVLDPSKCTHGNENYYNTREEAIATYKNKVKECDEKLKSGVIKTYEEYINLCPYGYQDYSCPFCGKWTISFYYR